MAVVLVWISPLGPAATSGLNHYNAANLKAQLDLVARVAPEDVVLATGLALQTQGIDPLAASQGIPERLLHSSWLTFSPMMEARKERLGLKDPLRVILRRKDVVWMAREYQVHIYQRFLAMEPRGPDTSSPQLEVQHCAGVGARPQGGWVWRLKGGAR